MQNNFEQGALEILENIKSSKNILLHLHVKPDPDSIGSALAMYHVLKNMGKEVTVIKGDTEFIENLGFLPGAGQIVHKNFFEIDLLQFDLFISLDSASTELISREGTVVFPENLKVIVIDHHRTNTKYGQINFIYPEYSATAELLFYVFKIWGIEIDKNTAANLYVGIFGDTGGFTNANTTVKTFEAITEIVKIYPDFTKLISELRSYPKGKIFFDALALNSIETFLNDTVAISSVSFEAMQEKGIDKNDMAASVVPNLLIGVKEWQIGVCLTEREKNQISVSFRSKNNIDVAQIAESLGGGGHLPAAGAFLEMSLDEAKKTVVEAISKFYP